MTQPKFIKVATCAGCPVLTRIYDDKMTCDLRRRMGLGREEVVGRDTYRTVLPDCPLRKQEVVLYYEEPEEQTEEPT